MTWQLGLQLRDLRIDLVLVLLVTRFAQLFAGLLLAAGFYCLIDARLDMLDPRYPPLLRLNSPSRLCNADSSATLFLSSPIPGPAPLTFKFSEELQE